MTDATDRGNDLALVEAALFLAPRPMTRRGLAKLLGDVRLAYVDRLLEDLAESYQDSARGIELHIEEGKALLRVKREYVNRVAHLAPQQDIPRPILRTLAVIAYNHPMTQADLVKVRGNKAYGHVVELIERGLVRSEPQSRTVLLHVTPEFLRHFGLSTVEEFRFHAQPPPSLPDDERDEREAAEREAQAEEEAPALSESPEDVDEIQEEDQTEIAEDEASPDPDASDEEMLQSDNAGGT